LPFELRAQALFSLPYLGWEIRAEVFRFEYLPELELTTAERGALHPVDGFVL
jgi:hypothetical protein